MNRIKLFDSLGSFGLDILTIVTGILFLSQRYIGWTVFYILSILLCITAPVHLFLNIRSGRRTANAGSVLLILFDILYLITILLQPAVFMQWLHVFFGWWMVGHGILSLIESFVLFRDRLPGKFIRLFFGLFALILAVFMIFGKNLSIKTDVLSLIAAIFFLVYGILGLLFHISIIRRQRHPDLPSWSFSPPVLLNAFFPLELFISLKELKKDAEIPAEKKQGEADLNVFIYMKGKGPEAFGHIDISYKGTILSYGNHDPQSRRIHGTYGDGVLIRADEKAFLHESLSVEGKTVVGYGLQLDEHQRKALEERIAELFSRTVPWKCAARLAEEAGQDMSLSKDYASRVYKGTRCDMFKFSKGKFRTYFVSSTNCVMLADELIRNKNLTLVNLTGIVTPGAYLSCLNSEYLKPNTQVISRTLYEAPSTQSPDVIAKPL